MLCTAPKVARRQLTASSFTRRWGKGTFCSARCATTWRAEPSSVNLVKTSPVVEKRFLREWGRRTLPAQPNHPEGGSTGGIRHGNRIPEGRSVGRASGGGA